MNSIVALGDRTLAEVAAAYAGIHGGAVWVYGDRTSLDFRFTALETLLEPIMDAYLASEALVRRKAFVGALRSEQTLCEASSRDDLVDGAERTLNESLEVSLRLIEMLDRAHIVHPVELVLVGDQTESIARTGIAWAKSRGIPSALLADEPALFGASPPLTDHVITFGERGQSAYEAIGLCAPKLAVLPNPKSDVLARLFTNRQAYRQAIETSKGIGNDHYLVAFEPVYERPNSTDSSEAWFDRSLQDMFAAFCIARPSVTGLHLVVAARNRVDRGISRVQRIADAHGVTPAEYTYTERDSDIWALIADVFVASESFRTIDVSGVGVPSINVWYPQNWFSGPVFAAEHGVIDASPEQLGSTLVALASNPAVAAQIGAVAREHARGFGIVVAAGEPVPGAVREPALAAIVESLGRYRTPAAPAVHIKTKPDIVIFAPNFTHSSAGVRALYRLCHLINMSGGNASILPATTLHPTWNTPRRQTNFTEKTIVVYPETCDRELPIKRTVRWVLNLPGLLAGPTTYDDDEMVFYYHQAYRAAAQAATIERLTDERELQVAVTEPELFYNDRSRPRLYDCVFIYKGKELYERVQPRAIRDAYIIQSGWPSSRSETAGLLRGCRRLYSFDRSSAILTEGLICGAEVYIVQDNGDAFLARWDVSDYVRQYYDLAPVERFLQLLDERWG